MTRLAPYTSARSSRGGIEIAHRLVVRVRVDGPGGGDSPPEGCHSADQQMPRRDLCSFAR